MTTPPVVPAYPMEPIARRWASRKLLVAGFGLVSSFVLAVLGKLSGDYATVVTVCVTAYSAANAYTTGSGGDSQ